MGDTNITVIHSGNAEIASTATGPDVLDMINAIDTAVISLKGLSGLLQTIAESDDASAFPPHTFDALSDYAEHIAGTIGQAAGTIHGALYKGN